MLIVVNTSNSTAVPYVPLTQKIIFVVILCAFQFGISAFFDMETEP